MNKTVAAGRHFGYLSSTLDAGDLCMTLNRRRLGDYRNGPTTYIAPSTTIVGSVSGEGNYIFCGVVEGDCDIDGPVTLAAGGTWRGTMRATDIVVSGEVEGDVVARQRVEISGTARVTGSLCGHSIAVAEGAVIDGEIRVTSGGEASTFEEKRRG